MRDRTSITLSLSCGALLSACGDGSDARDRVPPALIPKDTLIYVEARSLDALDEVDAALRDAFGDESGFKAGIEGTLAGFVDLDAVMTDRPLGATLEPTGSEPIRSLLLPTGDTDRLVWSVTEGWETPAKTDGYVAVSRAWSGAPSDVMAGALPAGVIRGRVDLVGLLAGVRPMIESGMEDMQAIMSSPAFAAETRGFDVGAMMGLYFDGFRAVMDSAERLDFAVDVDGPELSVMGTYVASEGSSLATFAEGSSGDIGDLAGFVDPDAVATFYLGADVGLMYSELGPFLDAVMSMYPEPMRTSFVGLMDTWAEISRHLSDGVSASVDMTPGGMRITYYMASDQPDEVVAEWSNVMRSDAMASLGVSSENMEQLRFAGAEVTRVPFEIDYAGMLGDMSDESVDPDELAEMTELMEAMYEDGMRLSYGYLDGVVVMVLGGDDAYLEKAFATVADGPRTPPADVQDALEAMAGSRAGIVMRMDVARLMAGVAGMMRHMFPFPSEALAALSDQTCPIVIHGVADGREWRGGVRLQLDRFAATINAFDG